MPVLFAAAASVACSSEGSDASFGEPSSGRNAGTPSAEPGASGTPASAERAIAEADIVQLVDGRLYALSRSGSLSIVDASKPGRLTMLGQAYLAGEPFEMYLRGDLLVVMSNGAYTVSGQQTTPTADIDRGETSGTTGGAASATSRDPNAGAGVIVINVKDPGLMQRVATFPVPGEIADSRVVGDILYLVTYENASCYRCGASPRTMVTSFNIASPTTMDQIDHAAFEGGAEYRSSWGPNGFKRSVLATSERLYVGGHGDVMPTAGSPTEGVIDVLDITDPRGVLGRGAHVETTGAIFSRWQMDEKDGVLRVVSQRGTGYATNGMGSPEVQTFHIWNTRSLQAMGKTRLKLPRQEALKSVRFDGDRAYAITFAESDPLFVIDLADEAAPRQRGELHMPGWVFHLEPHGDRVLGLGLDRRSYEGNLNVSLFDVADMDHPTMLDRVAFGPRSSSADAAIVNYELPEDQDRIQKAFRVFPSVVDQQGQDGGLVVVPFSGGQILANGCSSQGGVQLFDWSRDSLTKRAMLPVAGNPRRALLNQGELLAVSDSNVASFDIARRDVALKTADLVIGSCEPRTGVSSGGVPVGGRDGWWDDEDDHHHYACSMNRAGASSQSVWTGLALGVVAGLRALRRRSEDRGAPERD